MTKYEAIQLMRKGKKVRHRLFLPHEWITLVGEFKIKTEEGCLISQYSFWLYRKDPIWENDWEEV